CVTEERLVPVASPRLHAAVAPGDAWTSLPRLSLSGGREMWSQWFAFAGLLPAIGPTHRFDSFIAAMAAASAGAGVLLGSRPLVDGALATGELVRLSDRELPSASGHFLTYADDARLSPTALEFLSWIESAAFHDHDASFSGGQASQAP
ncbi:MAG TPA: LysR substrate-binding domain-containing protein, partial [Aestuariivirgaceae bacterium]|nr:LysR substrate-binding domain-containing protein [Aestuariivirgaceae bacterium]